MYLSKSFGSEVAVGVLEAVDAPVPGRMTDHRQEDPARFWADPPPGEIRVAA